MTRFVGALAGVLGVTVAMQFGIQGALAQSQDAQGTAPAVAASADASAAGTGRELQRRIEGGTIAALRKTANGSYEAQLLFDRQQAVYYVALLQQQSFWRVVRTSDETRANATYAMFARQTERFSNVEMQRTRVETQKAQVVQRLVAAREIERRLEADVEVAEEQAKLAVDRGQEERNQMLDLQAQQEAAQADLKETLNRIAKLQRQEKTSATFSRTR